MKKNAYGLGRIFFYYTLLFFLVISVGPGCTSAVVGAGASTGLAIYDERSVKTVARDTLTAAKLRAKMLQNSSILATRVGIDVHQDRVMLTGAIGNEQLMSDAVRIAWSVENVNDVINEIQLTNSGIIDMARDSWITMQFRARMTMDENIFAINYLCETVNGIIYLIGIAQHDNELERVINIAKEINYVQKVVNHVKVKR